jgi:hypothetical protein
VALGSATTIATALVFCQIAANVGGSCANPLPALAGGAIGFAAGAGLGALVGATVLTEQWEPLREHSIRPIVWLDRDKRGVGLSVSF